MRFPLILNAALISSALHAQMAFPINTFALFAYGTMLLAVPVAAILLGISFSFKKSTDARLALRLLAVATLAVAALIITGAYLRQHPSPRMRQHQPKWPPSISWPGQQLQDFSQCDSGSRRLAG